MSRENGRHRRHRRHRHRSRRPPDRIAMSKFLGTVHEPYVIFVPFGAPFDDTLHVFVFGTFMY